MNIKNDDGLVHLRSFGFRCEEHTTEGFLRYTKQIGNMLVTVANGQFENKIRVSLLQDKEGNIKTSYKDINEYTDLICALGDAGLLDTITYVNTMEDTSTSEYDMSENPLVSFPRKPDGFMIQ